MSEKAILSVQTEGARLFASDAAAEQQRWARVDLRSGFKDGSLDNLKRLLNAVQPTEIDRWISGEKPIPGSAQAMIAAALGKAPRLIHRLGADDRHWLGLGVSPSRGLANQRDW